MSNQYIASENQEILWNTFHKIPKVSSLDYPIRQSIFQECLGEIYHQLSPSVFHFSREELQELNKKTISLFLKKIQDTLGKNDPTSHVHIHERPFVSNTNYVYETVQERTYKEFEEKQKQYDMMTKKPDLPKPSELFHEPTDIDGLGESTIQNMDELIAQYQQQRDLDVPKYEGSLGISESDSSSSSSSPKKSPKESIVEKSDREYLAEILQKMVHIEHRIDHMESLWEKSFSKNIETKVLDENSEIKSSETEFLDP
jgi:hypothetical protein